MIDALCYLSSPTRAEVVTPCVIAQATLGETGGFGFVLNRTFRLSFIGVYERGGLTVTHIAADDDQPRGLPRTGFCRSQGRTLTCTSEVLTIRAVRK
jgi:hypothetical protein